MTFKELLYQQNFTQQRLAQHLHISQKAVSKWVCGKSIPTKENMLNIAKVLNINALIVIQSFYN